MWKVGSRVAVLTAIAAIFCMTRTPSLVGGQVREIGPVPLSRVKDGKTLRTKRGKDPLNGFDARSREGDVVAKEVDVSTSAAKIALHVDDDQRGVLTAKIAVERPGVGIGRNVGHDRWILRTRLCVQLLFYLYPASVSLVFRSCLQSVACVWVLRSKGKRRHLCDQQ